MTRKREIIGFIRGNISETESDKLIERYKFLPFLEFCQAVNIDQDP